MKFKNLSLKNAQQMLNNLECKISFQSIEKGETIKELYGKREYHKIEEKIRKT